MILGLVSDSHDNLAAAERVAAFFRARHVDLVVHLGDVCTARTLRPFRGMRGIVLRGNNDDDPALDVEAEDAEWQGPQTSWEALIDGLRVGATHGHHRGELANLIGRCDVALHGHTHVRKAEQVGRCLVVNPGALYRATPRTCALLELPTKQVEFYVVDDAGVRAM